MIFKWNKSRKSTFAVLIVLALSMILYFACDDKGLDPEFLATVSGEVTITTKVPDFTDVLVLALMKGLNPISLYTIPSDVLDDSLETQTIPFQMETQLGEFDAIFAIWKAHHAAIEVEENIVGSFCDGTLIPISVTDDNRTIENVDFEISLRKVNRISRVEGTINFTGDWPSDIDNLGIVFAEPTSVLGGLDVCNLLSTMDIQLIDNPRTPKTSMPFAFDVAPGANLMVVAWNRVGQSLFAPTIISDLFAGVFNSAEGDTVRNINITADFGTVQ